MVTHQSQKHNFKCQGGKIKGSSILKIYLSFSHYKHGKPFSLAYKQNLGCSARRTRSDKWLMVNLLGGEELNLLDTAKKVRLDRIHSGCQKMNTAVTQKILYNVIIAKMGNSFCNLC